MSDSPFVLDCLEPRVLRTATVTAVREGKYLHVVGTPAADVIAVRTDGRVVNVYDVSAGTRVARVPADRFKTVVIEGAAGRDEVRLDFALHNRTVTRGVETRRLYLPGKAGTRLTGDFGNTPVAGYYYGSVQGWLDHDALVRDRVTPQEKKAADVLLVGDSMAERFLTNGHATFDRLLRPRHVVDLGITGDTTAQVLYRLRTGLLDGYTPKAVVLVIGTNNLRLHDSVNGVMAGIRRIVREVRARLPDVRVVVNGIFPTRDALVNRRLAVVNTRLAAWADGDTLRFLNVAPVFSGSPVNEPLYRADLHLNVAGYRAWGELLVPVLDDLLAE